MISRNQALVLSALILASFAFGRFSAPEKIKVETKIVEVEKKSKDTVTDTDRDKQKDTTTTVTEKPDGTKETVTKTVERTKTDRRTTTREEEERIRQEQASKEVTKSTQRLSIYALAGIPISLNTPQPPVYGVHLSKDVFGPLSIGLWGLSSKVGGASIGLSF